MYAVSLLFLLIGVAHCTTASMQSFRPLFISHGAPTLPLERNNPTLTWLRQLNKSTPKPKALVVISAHWEEKVASVTSSNNQIYDFYGFPDALYKLKYVPPQAPEVAEQVKNLLEGAGIPCVHDKIRGLDHGTWNPLVVLFPEQDIPVVQLSLLRGLDPEAHIKMGEALRPLLKEDGIWVIASGSTTHNFNSNWKGVTIEEWTDLFEDWLYNVLQKDYVERNKSITNWRTESGKGSYAHLREEHLAPLFVLCGLAQGKYGERGIVTFRTDVPELYI